MGGPLWARKDGGGWSVPKGEHGPDETATEAARREFEEELGLSVPPGELVELGALRQPSGKLVSVWALEADLDPATMTAGTFQMEWPRGSGVVREFPEIDRIGWFTLEEARAKLVAGQRPFLDRLGETLQT